LVATATAESVPAAEYVNFHDFLRTNLQSS
jgi:hypothetical protein